LKWLGSCNKSKKRNVRYKRTTPSKQNAKRQRRHGNSCYNSAEKLRRLIEKLSRSIPRLQQGRTPRLLTKLLKAKRKKTRLSVNLCLFFCEQVCKKNKMNEILGSILVNKLCVALSIRDDTKI
jgi:hypothetical protein